MTDRPPPELDRLWDQIPAGTPPLEDLLRDGGAAVRDQRRGMRMRMAGAAVLVAGTAASGAWIAGSGDDRLEHPAVDNLKPTHTLTVATALEGPEAFYFEGALTEVTITSATQPETPVDRQDPAWVGWSHTWTALPPGAYDVVAAVRPCGGNCGVLDPATDSCHERVDLSADVDVVVTFHYAQACRISVPGVLTDQEEAYAIELSRQTLRREDGVVTSATAKAVTGTEPQSNTGYACESGRLLRIKLIGSFPHAVVSGPITIPGHPVPSDNLSVHAVLITADAETGHACLIGVQTGAVAPLPGATPLDLAQIGADPRR